MSWLHRKKALAKNILDADVIISCPLFTKRSAKEQIQDGLIHFGSKQFADAYFEPRGIVTIAFLLDGRQIYAEQKEYLYEDIVQIRRTIAAECEVVEKTKNMGHYKTTVQEALTSESPFIRLTIKKKYDEISSYTKDHGSD